MKEEAGVAASGKLVTDLHESCLARRFSSSVSGSPFNIPACLLDAHVEKIGTDVLNLSSMARILYSALHRIPPLTSASSVMALDMVRLMTEQILRDSGELNI